jgi:hypothetical protein
MTCCHKLEKVVFTLTSTHLDLVEKNRYMAAIKVIDPDVIQFLEICVDGSEVRLSM